MLIFDIETAPLPDDQLRKQLREFDGSEFEPSEFDPASVKTGNMKDVDKIAAKIEAARLAHEREQSTLAVRREQAEAEHWDNFKAGAALSATTGKVLAIGYFNPTKNACLISDGDGDERQLLTLCWHKYTACRAANRSMVGLNIHDFDLPFLVRRSWLLDVPVPPTVIEQNRFWDRIFVDLRKVWLLGQWGSGTKSNFDHLAAAFGTGGKPEGVTGADFARLWVEDRDAAVLYLTEDLKQPAIWAERMGVQ